MGYDFYDHLAEARQIAYLSRKGFSYADADAIDSDRRLALCIAYGDQDFDLPLGDLVPPFARAAVEDGQRERLRRFALEMVRQQSCYDDEALAALARDPDPYAWTFWQTTPAHNGQWFIWRSPKSPNEFHVDQVDVDEAGYIEIKYGCGLVYYSECQPACFDAEVLAVLAANEAEAKR